MLITAHEVVTGQELLQPGWLEVSGGRIVSIGGRTPPRPADLDLGEVTVVPGFVDTHVHGGAGATFSDATPEATRTARDLHLAHGTTTLVASLVSATPETMRHQVGVLSTQVRDGILDGIHVEGPWLSLRRCGAHEPSALRPPDPDEVDALLRLGAGTIRMVTLAPELPGALDAVRRVVGAGAVAAIGHTDGTYDDARAAVEAGATVATHLFNAMRPVHHREPGPVLALMENERVTLEMITDGTHLHPALYRQVMAAVGAERISLVTDAMAAAGMADGGYHLGPRPVDVVDGVARLAGAETIAGSTATMDRLFRFVLAESGLERGTALHAAVHQTSVGPARALGLPPAGLRPGAAADLVVLDSSCHLTRVMRRGVWVAPPPAADDA
ncbi:MAG: N-acetylglucosamine-6-phosphate deacetylase [Nocardioides sp.]|uniref:N-acetylglucosamine-6-phosphate deacetylase n=1 Tax=Nocardioides sp. TaxID=35761 RepID=UPI0039E4E187